MDYRSNRRSFGRSSVGGVSSEVPRWDPFAQTRQRPQTNRQFSGRSLKRLQRSRSMKPWSSNRGFGMSSRPSSGGRPPRWDPFVHERPQRSGGQFANRFGSRQQFSGSSRRPSFGRRGITGSRFGASQGYGSANRFGSRRSGRREIKSIIGEPPPQWMASRGMSSQSSFSGQRRETSQPPFSAQRMGATRPPFSPQRMASTQSAFSGRRLGASSGGPPVWDPFVQDVDYGSSR